MSQISCTYIGHATNIIGIGRTNGTQAGEVRRTNLITDPHFGRTTLFFPRSSPLPIDPANLPEISAILLSHTHYDHLHIASYKYFSCKTPIIIPEGSERAIGQFMPNPIVELSQFASHTLPCGTKITAVPARHRSGRVSQLRFTKTNAYIIESADSSARVFFCADSSYGAHFAEIGNLGKIDLALLPIGSYEPRFLLKHCHITPSEAVDAFEDLKALHMIPIHHGVFRLTFEKIDAPIAWLKKIMDERPDLKDKIHPLLPGEKFELTN